MGAYAQNRAAEDRIFSEPANAGGTQILLGLTEFLTGIFLSSQLTPEQKIIVNAKLRLQLAKDLPTDDHQREKLIKMLEAKEKSLDLTKIDEVRLETARTVDLATIEEKRAAIKVAEANLAKAQANGLKMAQELGLLDKSLRVVRIGTAVLLFGDVLGRIYVWNALDANPTFSPTITALTHLLTR